MEQYKGRKALSNFAQSIWFANLYSGCDWFSISDKLLNKEGVLGDFLIIKICKFLAVKIRILADLSKEFGF